MRPFLLDLVLALPWPALTTALAVASLICGAPYLAASHFYRARERYWRARLRAARAHHRWKTWRASPPA